MARKTYTSPTVKNRWNANHYDRMVFCCKKGGGDLMKELASENGQTFAEYMRQLVVQDAQKRHRSDIVEFFGGGV